VDLALVLELDDSGWACIDTYMPMQIGLPEETLKERYYRHCVKSNCYDNMYQPWWSCSDLHRPDPRHGDVTLPTTCRFGWCGCWRSSLILDRSGP